jgi:hypothetical protein
LAALVFETNHLLLFFPAGVPPSLRESQQGKREADDLFQKPMQLAGDYRFAVKTAAGDK